MQPDEPLNIEAFKAQMEALSEPTRAAVKEMVNTSFVFAYRNIETDSLKKYETFLSDATTMKFNKSIIEGMNRGLEFSISKWADLLAKILKDKK